MDLIFAFPALKVETEPSLQATQIFADGRVPSFPFVFPSISVVLRWDLTYEDRNKSFDVEVRFVDEDGRVIQNSVMNTVPVSIEAGTYFTNIMIHIHENLLIERPGRYMFDVVLEGKSMSRIPINLWLQ